MAVAAMTPQRELQDNNNEEEEEESFLRVMISQRKVFGSPT